MGDGLTNVETEVTYVSLYFGDRKLKDLKNFVLDQIKKQIPKISRSSHSMGQL
jgi:hypothetical protein